MVVTFETNEEIITIHDISGFQFVARKTVAIIVNNDKVKEVLNAPDSRKLIGYLCLGYVDVFYENPELERLNWEKRKDKENVVIAETY